MINATQWERLVSGDELAKIKRERNIPYITKTIFRSSLEDEMEDGWELFNEMKNPKKVKVKKNKPQDDVFEDTMWVLLANMGFTLMNRDGNFHMIYGDAEGQNQQIDVFAADDETVLLVECKSAVSMKDGNFKKDIETIGSQMQGLRSEAFKQFGKNIKVKFIFATNNYRISDEDLSRMSELGIFHFGEQEVNYYTELTKHLGTCARYQLLSNLFANAEIRGMDNQIPAIRGKMGGHTYYSFSIEPEKLLKIGYVLHRSEANSSMMPTYQRIIKKSRLTSVRKFINDEKGYFPNSIIISIDSKKPLQFDRSDKQVAGSLADLGILHLPKKYKSAYIIDGQHRLYGYSDSQYAKTNTIPVVAFENLEQTEQVKLFMEINENQKSVSKNLRNTLNADMLWVSPKESERRDALRLRIAQDLGDKTSSPLCGRIIIGEEASSSTKCITIESIRIAINVGNFLSKYDKKNNITQIGIFDLGNNDATLKLLYTYLELCLSYIKDNTTAEWNKGNAEGGILTINNGIGALIRVINDIANLLIDQKTINPFKDTPQSMAEATYYYLDPITRFIENINEETRNDIRTTYGGNGPVHCCRYYQKAIRNERSEFNPDGLTKYWEDHGKEYNQESIGMIQELEVAIKNIIRERLEAAYGTKWINEIPKAIYTKASQDASKQQYETGEVADFWDFVTILNCQEIVTFGKNWSDHFSALFTLPSEEKKTGGKKAKTEWMIMVDKLQKKAGKANFAVAKTEYQLLSEAHDRFVEE